MHHQKLIYKLSWLLYYANKIFLAFRQYIQEVKKYNAKDIRKFYLSRSTPSNQRTWWCKVYTFISWETYLWRPFSNSGNSVLSLWVFELKLFRFFFFFVFLLRWEYILFSKNQSINHLPFQTAIVFVRFNLIS
jgi:hypothetical protein